MKQKLGDYTNTNRSVLLLFQLVLFNIFIYFFLNQPKTCFFTNTTKSTVAHYNIIYDNLSVYSNERISIHLPLTNSFIQEVNDLLLNFDINISLSRLLFFYILFYFYKNYNFLHLCIHICVATVDTLIVNR